ncbi:hypothetical protein ACJRO7_021601 [Eucalyptus globulus]|uniref:TIR domain-containing protein n=1 Tax=Eucalyptus globulus TaxID=34317 RepID=A0ABD3KKN5_EUCGL
MHRLIFGYSFAELVAPILLLGLTLYFLNKKKASVRGNADDADSGTYDSMIVPTETNSVGSSSSPTETNSIGSSSLTVSIGNCYEVFLSFRGIDTRHGFTDHLYDGLLRAGIHTFRDDDELCHGEDIRPELMSTITNSKILIPIFSVNYGTSSWCLDELVQIMERKNNNEHIVLPIFYKVKPAEVRRQIGSFGKAFHEREKRLLERSSFDPAILEKWKQALLEVSNLKGYEADGSEVELVKSIVRKVLNELKKKFELDISKNLVGIDVHVKKVMEFVDNKSHDTLFVGIHGMGGIGKTTLAKAIYNSLFDQFEHRSFIADIRELWKRNGIYYLQNQLIYDILKLKDEVCNADAGTKFISSKFKSKKVLILLDDVDDVVQLQSLAGNSDWFSSGSKIIITTRNKRVLEEARVDHDYEHKEMDYNQSLILFSKHAFRRDSPPREFEDLTHEAVSITGGLPLSLEVFGSLLCGKESRQWRDTINKLKKVPPKKVQEKLRISYEALDYRQKQIFLDITCLFIGTNNIIASYMWDACDFYPGEGIEVLIFMSLIKVGDDHKLRMHDQLRDLGREIVREENQRQPWCRSRLWDYDEAQKVLKGNKGTEKIEAINLSEGSAEGFKEAFHPEKDGDFYTEKQFKNLTNLRYLHMINAHLSGDFKDLMKELKWLQWRKCPASFEVNNFDVKELAVLELQGSEINEKWGGWSFFKMAKKLKYLDLSYCRSLENTDFLSAFEKLEVLILGGCWRLKRIDSSIEDRKGLLRLELGSSRALHLAVGADAGTERSVPRFCLRELPAKIGKLKALKQLDLSVTSLSALPNSIGSLENLEILDISWSGIEELPNGIGSLRKLRELRAHYCRYLKGIMVESMCNLSSLRHLGFIDCYNLQSLPDLPSGLTYLGVTCQSRKLPLLSHLAHLKELQVRGCGFVQCIQELPSTQLKSSKCSQLMDIEESESPQSLNTPLRWECLEVHSCGSIEMLDVSQFVHLKKLNVESCAKLAKIQGLDRLEYLERLYIINCALIERLDLSKSGRLKELKATSCKNLAEIEGLDRSEYLEGLDIRCALIERLDLPKSGRLKELQARGCVNLAEIQGLNSLEYLESIDICGCTSIRRLDLPKFGRLKELQARGCVNLAEIQGLNSLEYLESLDICGCTSIRRLDLPKFGRLKELQVRECVNLAEIQGLDSLEYLESLDIFSCTSIGRLDLPKFGRLKELCARECVNLAEIQWLDSLKYLESLDIFSCTSIGRLDLPKFGRLKELNARECVNLAEIKGLDNLEYLESLDIFSCTSIGRLDLPKFGRLKELNARECVNLAKIQGLDSLEYLESLDIFRCISIRRLDLPKSRSMKRLDVDSCEKLAEIQGLDRLESLKTLYVCWCLSIERLLLPKSESLKILDARGCKNLVEIRGLDRLKFLKKLNISGCKTLKTIPELFGTRIYGHYEIADGEMIESGSDYTDDSDEEYLEGFTSSDKGT